MRAPTFVSGLVVAIALAFTAGSVTAFGQSATPQDAKATPNKTAPVSGNFATLSGVKAVPMAPRELSAVKGLHIHFTTPSGLHFVNQAQNNLGNGQANPGSGPGYSGLCGAALNSPALAIPGQNTTTGIGGGC